MLIIPFVKTLTYGTFANTQQIIGGTLQDSFRLDDRILIADDVVELGVVTDDRVLHDDAVADDRILSDPDATEEDRVFNAPFDDAAVGYKGVGNVGFFHVLGRRFVFDLGINAVIQVFEKQFVPNAAVAQIHVDFKIRLE